MLAAFAGSGVAALNEGEGIGRDALHQNESQHPTKGKWGTVRSDRRLRSSVL